MSWEEDFRRNIERTRQRILEIAPDMLDLSAHRAQLSPKPHEAHRWHHPAGRTQCGDASISNRNMGGVGDQSPQIIRGKTEKGWLPPKGKTSDVDPGRPGPYSVCRSTPTVFAQAKLAQDPKITQDVPLLAYAPGSMSGVQCISAVSDCPLVVIFHAQPAKEPLAEYYKYYEALGAHLASYGYVVLSIGWGVNNPVNDPAYAKFLITQLIAWIAAGGLNLKSIISDQLIIWGHSRGGGLSSAAAGAPLGSFELSALVLMSSIYPMYLGAGAKAFKSARSFLGIHTKTDSDPSTSGGPNSRGNADDTVVTLYETAGATDDASQFLLDKHLVFRHSLSGDHFYQDDTVVLGYTAAFLQRHVRKLSYFDRFIRRQRPMASIGGEIAIHHLHEDKLKKIVFSWSGFPEYQVNGATITGVGNLRSIDEYVLNSAAGLRLSFVRGSACTVRLFFNAPPFFFWDASMYAYLSIAICQSHVLGLSENAPIRPIVTVWSGQSSTSVDLDNETGRILHYPRRYTALMIDQTRVSLDEFFIPTALLSKSINLVGLSALTIDLTDATPSGADAVVLIGEIKLTGYGAP